MKQRQILAGLVGSGLIWMAGGPGWAAPVAGELDITRSADGFLAPVTMAISGFSPEVTAVLRFDLLFMGFTNVGPEQAQFLISGSNAGQLQGRVVDRISKQQRLGKAYTGGTWRAQTHAFADDIAKTLTGVPGIAQTKIAFRTETGGGMSEIYVADYDGFNAQAVTHDGTLTVSPNWAGRGGLVYASYKQGRPFIYSHNLSTGARGLVAKYPGSNITPAASPDGRRVAMILSRAGSPDLYVCNVDGSGLKRLTETRAEESSPCWAPDGRAICYVSRSSGVNWLYAVSPEGGAPRRIATSGVPNATEPSWSPDGKWIAFTSLMRDFSICMVKAGGGKAEMLALGEDPSWAANSRAIIFCKGPDHRKQLSLLDVPTKQVKDVTRILESNSQPSWAD